MRLKEAAIVVRLMLDATHETQAHIPAEDLAVLCRCHNFAAEWKLQQEIREEDAAREKRFCDLMTAELGPEWELLKKTPGVRETKKRCARMVWPNLHGDEA